MYRMKMWRYFTMVRDSRLLMAIMDRSCTMRGEELQNCSGVRKNLYWRCVERCDNLLDEYGYYFVDDGFVSTTALRTHYFLEVKKNPNDDLTLVFVANRDCELFYLGCYSDLFGHCGGVTIDRRDGKRVK